MTEDPLTRRRRHCDRLLRVLADRTDRGVTSTTDGLAAESGLSYPMVNSLLASLRAERRVERVKDPTRPHGWIHRLLTPRRSPQAALTDGGVPACDECGKANGWTRYIQGHTRCEACSLDAAIGKTGAAR
jgi:hypothetical protein